jgi:hypothetical protein
MSVQSALHKIADLINHQDLHAEIDKPDEEETDAEES